MLTKVNTINSAERQEGNIAECTHRPDSSTSRNGQTLPPRECGLQNNKGIHGERILRCGANIESLDRMLYKWQSTQQQNVLVLESLAA